METVQLPIRNAPGKYALVDGDYDGEWLGTYTWRVTKNGHAFTSWHQPGSGKVIAHQLSRMAYGESFIPARHWVTTKNGNPLDCRTENLVCMSASEVLRTVRPQGKLRDSSSGYRGVTTYNAPTSHFYVTFVGDYLRDAQGHLRKFSDAKEAARAYDEAAKERWGAFATLNFPDGKEPTMERLPLPEPTGPEARQYARDQTVLRKRNVHRELTNLLEGYTAMVANWFGGDLSLLEKSDWDEVKRVQDEIEKLIS